MKLFTLFKKVEEKEKTASFSEFFLHASEDQKHKVLKEAAQKANEDQREVFLKSKLKMKAS